MSDGVRSSELRLARAQLVLDKALRAKTPDDANAVGQAVGDLVKTADSHEEMDLLDEAMAIARSVMDAYLGGRVKPISERRRP